MSEKVGQWTPAWMLGAEEAMRKGDGEWVKMSEHLTRQSAERTRTKLRRQVDNQQFEIWVTVDRDWISPEVYERGHLAWKGAVERGATRLKSRRPAAVLGRWREGSLAPEENPLREAGRSGGLTTAKRGLQTEQE